MKKNEINKTMKTFDTHNESKWMRYEKDIIQYYYPKVIEWMDEGFKWSGVAFTSGLGRNIANLIENGIKRKNEIYKINIIKAIDQIEREYWECNYPCCVINSDRDICKICKAKKENSRDNEKLEKIKKIFIKEE